MRKLGFLRPLLACAFLLAANPAEARITVIDAGVEMTVGGYCTPGQVGSSDCAPQALPFGITVGGTTYNSFVLNGNGTLTLGNGGIDWNVVSNSAPNLASYPMPVFSPDNDNSITFRELSNPDGTDLDTRWAASVTSAPDNSSLTAYWFRCSTAIFCGTESLDASLYDGFGLTIDEVRERQTWGMFGLTLTDLPTGFQLDYFYYPVGDPPIGDTTGTYGFNLPGTASLQTNGSLVNRTWIFDELGQVVAVPEPATWLMMLIGFAGIGLTVRRQRKLALLSA